MEKTNHCKTGGYLSRCTLTETKERYKCKFFKKASNFALNPNQCRFYRPDYDEHCDNVDAQMDAEKPEVKEEKPVADTDLSY